MSEIWHSKYLDGGSYRSLELNSQLQLWFLSASVEDGWWWGGQEVERRHHSREKRRTWHQQDSWFLVNLHLDLFWKILHHNPTQIGKMVHVKSDETAGIHFDLCLYFAQVAEMMQLIASIYHNKVSSFFWLASYYNPALLLANTRNSRP